MGMDATPALIPNAAPPAKRRKSALSWTPDENQFADRLLTIWNDTVGKIAGKAYNVRGNRGAAVRFYRRNCSAPPEDVFTEEMIRAGFAAYAECPPNVKLKSWKTFHDFVNDAEDLIAKQLARIGYKPTDSAAAQARELLDHLELGRLAREANANKDTLIGHVRSLTVHWARRASKQPRESSAMLAWLGRIRELHHRLRSLESSDRSPLFMRASLLFGSLAERPYHGTQSDNNLVGAIALALLDKEAAK